MHPPACYEAWKQVVEECGVAEKCYLLVFVVKTHYMIVLVGLKTRQLSRLIGAPSVVVGKITNERYVHICACADSLSNHLGVCLSELLSRELFWAIFLFV
jgi:hypothetical protein